MSDLITKCKRIADTVKCDFEVLGADTLTTFKGGGKACVFLPKDEHEFIDVYGAVAQEIGKPFILGGGSDTIMADGFCKTPVICQKRLDRIYVNGDRVYAQCGAYINSVMSAMRASGLCGFEFLCGVPATVGGAVKMNASAFSSQTADYIDEICVLSVDSASLKPITLKRDDIKFAYRDGAKDIVLSAVFKGESLSADVSKEMAKRYLELRAQKQPKYPSCGSVFKNTGVPSGKLIEECGLKGLRIGGAQISELHGNFIVNLGGATSADFTELVSVAEKEVYKKFGVSLQREFVYLD